MILFCDSFGTASCMCALRTGFERSPNSDSIVFLPLEPTSFSFFFVWSPAVSSFTALIDHGLRTQTYFAFFLSRCLFAICRSPPVLSFRWYLLITRTVLVRYMTVSFPSLALDGTNHTHGTYLFAIYRSSTHVWL